MEMHYTDAYTHANKRMHRRMHGETKDLTDRQKDGRTEESAHMHSSTHTIAGIHTRVHSTRSTN